MITLVILPLMFPVYIVALMLGPTFPPALSVNFYGTLLIE